MVEDIMFNLQAFLLLKHLPPPLHIPSSLDIQAYFPSIKLTEASP